MEGCCDSSNVPNTTIEVKKIKTLPTESNKCRLLQWNRNKDNFKFMIDFLIKFTVFENAGSVGKFIIPLKNLS